MAWLTPDTRNLIYTRLDRVALLSTLGARGAKQYGRDIRSTCPIHGGEGFTNFVLYGDTNWQCKSHHCHNEEKQDIFSLVMRVKQLKFPDALSFVAAFAGVSISLDKEKQNVGSEAVRHAIWSSTVNQKDYERSVDTTIDYQYVRECMLKRTDYMLVTRNFPEWVLNDFSVGHCFGWRGIQGEDRATFPIFLRGEVVGVQGRAVTGVGTQDKYPKNPWPRNIKYDTASKFPKAQFLYNYDRALEYARITGEMGIAEGVTDVMRLHQYGICNVTSTWGSSVSKWQRRLLIQTGVTRVVMWYDWDEPGLVAIENAIKVLHHYFDILVAPLPHKDPEQCSPDELYSARKNAVRRLRPNLVKKRVEEEDYDDLLSL